MTQCIGVSILLLLLY